ncbi:DUF6931 family protein [Yersinia mollaretii]|uniref:Uncharacterized protein n=1 Tax=Yersinia mollaretii TaxID=33060 RepID=A0AA36LPE7_YERMO|nr:hypothetical protein [Yersinia mollaretii]CNI51042.1 Uncharacterised protein [Yersinia mollaretii]
MNKLSQLIGAENRALMQPLRPWRENAQVLLAHGQWEAMFILWMEQHSYRRALQIAHACLSDAPNDVVWQDCHADIALWLAEPDDELRWRIFQHGNSLGFASALGAMALSLFWSEGSMAPAGLDAVYPEADLSPTMLLCSLKSSSLALAGEQLPLVGARTLMDKLLSAEGGR